MLEMCSKFVRYYTLGLALLSPLWAQYSGISFSPDNSHILVGTSLRQKAASPGQPTWGKLFRVDDSGVRPFLIRNRDVISSSSQTNGYDLREARYSPDGRWLAVTGGAACLFPSGGICQSFDENRTTLYDAQGEDRLTIPGRGVVFSENGNWMASTSQASPASTIRLWDLRSMTSLNIIQTSEGLAATGVSNDGSVLVAFGSGGPYLYPASGSPVRIAGEQGNALLSADGSRIAFNQQGKVWIRTGTTMREVGEGNLRGLNLAGDVILRQRDRQLRIGDLKVAEEPSGFRQVELSGDGHLVCYTTGDGALIRVAADGTGRTELIPGIAVPEPAYSVTANLPRKALYTPGEPVTVDWSSASSPALRPVVLVDGAAAPVLRVQSGAFTFQVPWETPVAPGGELEVQVSSGVSHPVWRTDWVWLASNIATNGSIAAVIHQGFDSLVSPTSPALPSEVLHLYGIGLGPVVSPPPTGSPALGPVPLITPLTCGATEVLYAGLAPGLLGYYQVDLRLPLVMPAGFSSYTLRCSSFSSEVPIVRQ